MITIKDIEKVLSKHKQRTKYNTTFIMSKGMKDKFEEMLRQENKKYKR